MKKRISISILVASMTVLLLTMTLIMGFVYNYYSNLYVENLQNEAQCLTEAINVGGTGYLNELGSSHRITIVNADGTVFYDSQMDAATMENHLEREEIKEALSQGKGFSERYSSTISEKTVNITRLLSDGKVLRVSDTNYTLLMLVLSMSKVLCVILILSILFSLIMASRLSRKIVMPINEINLENPDESKVYSELTPLLNRISTQNKQIEKQMTELKTEHDEQDEMRREFTANVSHELKTPLTSISGYAEIIRDGIAKAEDVKRFSGKIYDESQRLITLVGDIINLSRLEGKEVPVEMTKIDLYDCCVSTISHLEAAARKKGVNITVKGEHCTINGAEKVIEEMIYNICDNAIKYNKDNGSVAISIKQCIDGVELTVSDTGIGIPDEYMDRIFERFYRVDKSHSKEIGGTGLGLSIVKHGAILHNAAVSVESKLGIGTTVRIRF